MNKQGGSQFTQTQQQALMLLEEVYKKQTGKDPKQDQQGFGQFVNQLQQKTGIKDVGQFLDAIYQQAQQQASNQQPSQQQQTLAARHGAKLNYIKSLKNQCPEGQEPYYYKKGGMVKCGCAGKKLMEDGGKTESAIDKFKKAKKEQKGGTVGRAISKVAETTVSAAKKVYDKKVLKKLDPRTTKTLPGGKYPDNWDSKDRETWERNYGENDEGAAVARKCGGKVKKHQLGGGLNGVQYRFRRSTNDMNNGYKTYSDQIMMTRDPEGYPTYDLPPISAGRTIYVTPQGNDTIFYTNNSDVFNKTPKKDLNQRRAKQKFYQLIKRAPIEGEEYRNTQYWNSNYANQDAIRNRALKGN